MTKRSPAAMLSMSLLLIALVAGLFGGASPARAATFTIPCNDIAALVTAITTANTNNQPDVIELASGCTYSFTDIDNADNGATALPTILPDTNNLANTVTINGNGATFERDPNSKPFRFLYISGGFEGRVALILNNLTLRGGESEFDGGAINSRFAGLTLDRVVFENNRATYNGGALATLNVQGTISNSIFSANQAGFGGGALDLSADGDGSLVIDSSAFVNNQTNEDGGAIQASHALTIVNSTFSGNQAAFDGSAISSVSAFFSIISSNSARQASELYDTRARLPIAQLTLAYTTITDNITTVGNGAVSSDSFQLCSTIIAGNTDVETVSSGYYPDLYGALTDIVPGSIRTPANVDLQDCAGYNLIGDLGDFVFDTNTTGDQYGDTRNTTTPSAGAVESATPINPLLSPLAANGGPTPTRALQPGSPALNQIPPGVNGCDTTILVDQRGSTRPHPNGGNCDIGAFEAVPPPPPPPPPPQFNVYLPLIVNTGLPDLTITSIDIIPNKTAFTAGEPVEIRVTVKNIGITPSGPFWVDLYLNPSRPPQINDLWHNLCGLTPCFGATWGVTQSLQPGEQIVLTTTGGYDIVRTYWLGWLANGTTTIYAQADSWNITGVTGAVSESNEANNIAQQTGLTVTGVNPPYQPWQPPAQVSSESSLPARPALTTP